MTTTPTRASDPVRDASSPTRRPAMTFATVGAVAILVVAAFWFIGTRSGGPDAFPVLDDDDIADASDLAEVIAAYEATWDTADLQAFADLLAVDDFTFIEPGTLITSKDGFVAYMDEFFVEPGLARSIDRRYFVGDGELVESYLTWGWAGIPETNPVVEVELFTLKDGFITSIHSMYDPAMGPFAFGLDPTDLLVDYAAAWSSGNPDELVDLYASDARRTEGLYRIELRGIDEITRHAAAFFERHPASRWTIAEPYVFTSGMLSGAVLTLSEPDGCDMEMAVLVELDDAGLISEERIYHDISAIQACAWQR